MYSVHCYTVTLCYVAVTVIRMLERVIWAVLLAFLVYRWLPSKEDCLLVLVQAEESQQDRIKAINNVRHIFKVERNIDFHMKMDDETVAAAKVGLLEACRCWLDNIDPVSYTHLTLPTKA